MANYVIKNDNPDFGYSVDVGEVRDAEGEVLPDEAVVVEVASSDADVLALSPDSDSSGSIHVGHSGIAQFSVQVKDLEGNILGSHGDSFTVTVGEPASVSDISTSFEGLSPVEDGPAEPPVDVEPEPAPEPEPVPEG